MKIYFDFANMCLTICKLGHVNLMSHANICQIKLLFYYLNSPMHDKYVFKNVPYQSKTLVGLIVKLCKANDSKSGFGHTDPIPPDASFMMST